MAAAQPQTPEAKQARLWIGELDACEKWQRTYLERCKRILRRYRNDNATAEGQPDFSQRRFAILWANIQTLGPAVYARTPTPVVGRRFKDADPVGRYASEVLERALKYGIDQYDFADMMQQGRDDYLLFGRGQAWVRYVPHTNPPQVTNTADEEVSESPYAETVCDHLNNEDWGFTPGRSWDEAWYVWRRVFMTRAELIERFGKEIGKKIPLDWKPKDDPGEQNSERSTTKKAAIYEIWDKNERKVSWVSRGYEGGALEVKDDWLGLERFFPCPRPMMATTPQDQYLPVPDFVYYQDQAEEIDELTSRIATLSDAIKMVGFYAGEENTKLQNMFGANNNELIAVGSMASLAEKGGLKGIIEWMPTDQTAKTLVVCIETRKQLLNDIYEITGISDIVRGASDPNETATAQGIKEQWGSLRVRDRQKEVARFARDLLQIKGEIIAKKYQPQMLAAMTDVHLPTQRQKQAVAAAEQQNAQAQQMGAQPIPIPPELKEIADRPTWEEVTALLQNDALRSFRIDIETDSTIEPNETLEKTKRVEFVGAMSEFLIGAAQIVPIMPAAMPLIGDALKYLARGFDAGRELEDSIERFVEGVTANPPAPPQQEGGQKGPSPEQLQIEGAKVQQAAQQSQAQDQIDQGNQHLEAAKLQQEGQNQQFEQAARAKELQLEERQQIIDHQANQQAHVVAMRPQPPRQAGGR